MNEARSIEQATTAATTPARVVKPYIQRGHIEQTAVAVNAPIVIPNVAAYTRVSTKADDQLNSQEVQDKFYTEYITANKSWNFAGIYADPGLSGTSLRRRKKFNEMIATALRGEIDIIIVKSVSRFARNTVDSLQTIRDLREKNVKVIFEKENIDSLDPKCDLHLSIYSTFAEEESRSISNNIRWRVQKKFENGEVIMNFGNLYGYMVTKDDKEITIDEYEAQVVRDIYRHFLIGWSFKDIIDELASNDILSPRGGARWYKSTINSILQNEKYMGDAILQKTYKRDVMSVRRVKNTGQAPQSYVDNNHPAIIDRETWNAVQGELERRNSLRSTEETGKGRYVGQYAFSGKIECAICGAGYRRHNYKFATSRLPVWTCKEHIKSKDICAALPIKESELEDLFVKTLSAVLTDRDAIADAVSIAVSEAIAEAGEAGQDLSGEIHSVGAEIEKLQAQILELSKQRARRELDAEQYNIKNAEVINRLDALFEKRDELTGQQNIAILNTTRQKMLDDVLENITRQTTFDKDIFTQLIAAVRIKSRTDIIFEFKDGSEVKAIIEDAEPIDAA